MALSKAKQLQAQIDELEKASAKYLRPPLVKVSDTAKLDIGGLCAAVQAFIPVIELVVKLPFIGKKFKAAVKKHIANIKAFCSITE